jgi:hypothetical protein
MHMCAKSSFPFSRLEHRLSFLGIAVLLAAVLTIGACSTEEAGTDTANEAKVPLSGTFPSIEALAEEILLGIEANDFEALIGLALSKAEYRDYVWPQLPASRPGTNLTVDYTYQGLRTKSFHALRFTLEEHGGRKYELLGVEFAGETTDYNTYRVFRDARVLVRNEEGNEGYLDLFGSVMEYRGQYKLFSFVTD